MGHTCSGCKSKKTNKHQQLKKPMDPFLAKENKENKDIQKTQNIEYNQHIKSISEFTRLNLRDCEWTITEIDSNLVIQHKDQYFKESQLLYYQQLYQNEYIDTSSQFINMQEDQIRFLKGETLGRGSFGCVIQGLNIDTGEIIAIKQVIIMQNSQVQQERVKALQQEIKLLKQFRHPNIIKYIGSNRTNDIFNIFLEYVPGGTIASLLQKYGRFNEDLIRVYTKQIIDGLEYLHSHKVIHSDIKASNVLVDSNGMCKLADFGSAKKIYGFKENEKMQQLRGTAFWMAPEIIKQTGSGRFADIWSLGCTVIEMATGRPPWSDLPNQFLAMYHIAKGQSAPKIPRNISAAAIDFIQCCLRKNPKDRLNIYELKQHKYLTGVSSIPFQIKQKKNSSEKENKTQFKMNLNYEIVLKDNLKSRKNKSSLSTVQTDELKKNQSGKFSVNLLIDNLVKNHENLKENS